MCDIIFRIMSQCEQTRFPFPWCGAIYYADGFVTHAIKLLTLAKQRSWSGLTTFFIYQYSGIVMCVQFYMIVYYLPDTPGVVHPVGIRLHPIVRLDERYTPQQKFVVVVVKYTRGLYPLTYRLDHGAATTAWCHCLVMVRCTQSQHGRQ